MTTEEFRIGSDVVCADGPCGELRRVVVELSSVRVTHVVAEPRHERGTGRLVPARTVSSADGVIRLDCTLAELHDFEPAEETTLVPPVPLREGATGDSAGDEPVTGWPYFGLGVSTGAGAMAMGLGGTPEQVSYDRVPEGTVELCGGEHVFATDGPVGRVRGVVAEAPEHRLTHLLLDEGHLWGHKRVALPAASITGFEGGVHVGLTKEEVRDLRAT